LLSLLLLLFFYYYLCIYFIQVKTFYFANKFIFLLQSLVQEGKRLSRRHDPADRVRGFICFERALSKNESEAIGLVAECLMFGGKSYGVEQNLPRALDLARQGAALQPPDSTCLAVLGRCSLYGLGGVKKDEEVGVSLLQRAIELENPSAMYYLGCFFRSRGKDWAHAVPAFSNASPTKDLSQNPPLLEIAGSDWSHAVPLLKRAEKLGHAGSMSELALYYEDIPEPARVFEHHRRAAVLGYGPSMLKLAELLIVTNPPQLLRAKQLIKQAHGLGIDVIQIVIMIIIIIIIIIIVVIISISYDHI
jgi:hypothetical protein